MSEWTPKLRLKLTERWKAGASATAIAAEFGMTRGQINGMIWRLGLKTNLPNGRPRARKVARPRQAEPKRAPKKTLPQMAPAVPAAAEPVRAESQSEQECLAAAPRAECRIEPPAISRPMPARECAWPIGDPRDASFHFCGAPAAAGRPYCNEHSARAYVVIRKGADQDLQEAS